MLEDAAIHVLDHVLLHALAHALVDVKTLVKEHVHPPVKRVALLRVTPIAL